RQIDQSQRTITSGIFYKLPYTTSLPVSPSNTDTLQAVIDGSPWTGKNVIAGALGGQLTISGSAPDGTQAVGIILPAGTLAGTYNLNYLAGVYIGVYVPAPPTGFVSSTGTLDILQNDVTNFRIRGDFQFYAIDPQGTTTA